MKLSAKTEYACLAMLQLAADFNDGSPAPLRTLAAKQNIPEGFLVQILQELRRSQLVVSTRGSSGGYRLARTPSDISLGEVIHAIDGPVGDNVSPDGNPFASALHSLCLQMRSEQQDRLENLSLAEIVEQASAQAAPMWHI